MAYAIGLDYGTNSVRCLIVDTRDGREVGSCVHEYESGQAGILLSKTDHNVARQSPADYLKGVEAAVIGAIAAGEEGRQEIQGRGCDRHRRGYDRLDAPAGGQERHAAGDAQGISQESQRAWRGCGRTTRAMPRPRRLPKWRDSTGRNTWPSAAGLIRRSGFSARFCIACGRTRRFSRRPLPGWSTATGCRRC